MSAFATVEILLIAGDFIAASDEFGRLRPNLKTNIEGLKLAARIHSAAKNWDKVGVLSRVMRNEFPADLAGFELGANSLHQQGRDIEAINLLKLCEHQHAVSDLIAEYQANLDSGAPVDITGSPT